MVPSREPYPTDPIDVSDGVAGVEKARDHELRALSSRFPDVDSAVAEIARLAAVLTLSNGPVSRTAS
jgi:fructose-1,6-bisphosphatase-3